MKIGRFEDLEENGLQHLRRKMTTGSRHIHYILELDSDTDSSSSLAHLRIPTATLTIRILVTGDTMGRCDWAWKWGRYDLTKDLIVPQIIPLKGMTRFRNLRISPRAIKTATLSASSRCFSTNNIIIPLPLVASNMVYQLIKVIRVQVIVRRIE